MGQPVDLQTRLVDELAEVCATASEHGGVREVDEAPGAGSGAGAGQGIDGGLLVLEGGFHTLDVMLEVVYFVMVFSGGGALPFHQRVDVILCLVELGLEGSMLGFGRGISGGEARKQLYRVLNPCFGSLEVFGRRGVNPGLDVLGEGGQGARTCWCMVRANIVLRRVARRYRGTSVILMYQRVPVAWK